MKDYLTLQNEDFGFWKNIFLTSIFFIITPLTIGVSLFSLYSLKKNDLISKEYKSINVIKSGVSVYASLPDNIPSVKSDVESSDARPFIVSKYLSYYNSPLVPYASFIVQTADKYSIDFRLITAIAQQESNLCKVIPPGSYNCWGWGITSVGTLGFNSYEDAIETVSKGIKENYLDKGYSTVEDIMGKYTPQSNGSWARGVSMFMDDMQ